MTRAAESGAYLGGIGTMLTQSEVCPSCGRVHAGRRFGFLGSTKGECPVVVFGSFPVLAEGSEDFEDPIPQPYPERASTRAGLTAEPAPPLPAPTFVRKASGMNVPWPMPSHLEDYL